MTIQTHNSFNLFPVLGPLGGFQQFAIINITAMNIFLHMAFIAFLIIASR